MTNIFEIIGKVTSRIEPFHSEFLTAGLRDNKKLLIDFLKLRIQRVAENEALFYFAYGQPYLYIYTVREQ